MSDWRDAQAKQTQLPTDPQWARKRKADVGGKFWLPCPICGTHFSGYEFTVSIPRINDPLRGQGVCPWCVVDGSYKNYEFDPVRGIAVRKASSS